MPHTLDLLIWNGAVKWEAAGEQFLCFPVVLAGRVVAGLRLARTASERRGSADRHSDVRGSGPQVGCAQAVAPDLMRRAVLGTAVRSRGSCLRRRCSDGSWG